VDSENQVPDAEALECLADRAAMGLVADHGRPCGPTTVCPFPQFILLSDPGLPRCGTVS
jgi:hypothetical protein